MDIAVVDLSVFSSLHGREDGTNSLDGADEGQDAVCRLVADSLQRTGCVIVSEGHMRKNLAFQKANSSPTGSPPVDREQAQ